MNKVKPKASIVCPKCGMSHNYRRISTGEQVCQKCGYVWKQKKKNAGGVDQGYFDYENKP